MVPGSSIQVRVWFRGRMYEFAFGLDRRGFRGRMYEFAFGFDRREFRCRMYEFAFGLDRRGFWGRMYEFAFGFDRRLRWRHRCSNWRPEQATMGPGSSLATPLQQLETRTGNDGSRIEFGDTAAATGDQNKQRWIQDRVRVYRILATPLQQLETRTSNDGSRIEYFGDTAAATGDQNKQRWVQDRVRWRHRCSNWRPEQATMDPGSSTLATPLQQLETRTGNVDRAWRPDIVTGQAQGTLESWQAVTSTIPAHEAFHVICRASTRHVRGTWTIATRKNKAR
jgi:hypothetical protein